MAIYTVHGCKTKIKQDYGDIKVGITFVRPVLIEFRPRDTIYYDAYYLRADGGVLEVQRKLNKLGITKISYIEMKRILSELL